MNIQNPISKYKQNPMSLRSAINAHCYVCMGGSEADLRTKNRVVSDIKACASKVCPLLTVRPFNPSLTQGNSKLVEAMG